jgi:hypothetical protein
MVVRWLSILLAVSTGACGARLLRVTEPVDSDVPAIDVPVSDDVVTPPPPDRRVPPPDEGNACFLPRRVCNFRCVDLTTDAAHCGACGRVCSSGQRCVAGTCGGAPTASGAGAPCTMADPMGGKDPACGDLLLCVPSGSTPFCTSSCENDPSQATERTACGGADSTCLSQGDGDSASSICTAACRPTAMTVATGACRAGQVCTGWWYTHAGARPDATGCYPFCSQDSDCGAGATGPTCNPRTGACGAAGADLTRLADGSPCNPRLTVMVPGEERPRNVQCRGTCFATSSARPTEGICGSFINTRVATACPDSPDTVEPRAPTGADNLAICIFKTCSRNADCTAPHVCRYPEDATGMPATDTATTCDYPTTQQPRGIP